MNINDIIMEQITNVDFETIIKEQVAQSLTAMVKSQISDQFRPYGTLSKNLEEQLKKEMDVDFSTIKLQKYRDYIIDSMSDEIAKHYGLKESEFDIRTMVNTKILLESRDSITFETFEEEVIQMILEDLDIEKEEFDQDWYDGVSIEIENDKSSYMSSSDYKKINVTIQEEDHSYRNKETCFTFFLSKGKVYHWSGDVRYLKQWARALKYVGTEVTGI